MSRKTHTYVCPAKFAGTLDNRLRRLVHNPYKILKPYIAEGMTVLDLGCGPGYFTAGLAELAGKSGRVIAADLQEEMLGKMIGKIRGMGLDARVEPHLCLVDAIGLNEKVDFVLAFWMAHEVPDQIRMFSELRSILKPGGRIWIIEPKFHVTAKAFMAMTDRLESAGLKIIERPKVALSRSVIAVDDEL